LDDVQQPCDPPDVVPLADAHRASHDPDRVDGRDPVGVRAPGRQRGVGVGLSPRVGDQRPVTLDVAVGVWPSPCTAVHWSREAVALEGWTVVVVAW